MQQTFRNKSYDIAGKKVVIRKLAISGADKNRVALQVDFSGDKTGTVYLTGTPVLDVEKQVLSIPDLDYALNTADVTLNMGKQLFNKKILRMLRQKAVINVAEVYQRNQAKLDASLNREIRPGIRTAGYTTGMRLLALVVKKDNIMLQASVTGHITVVVSHL